MEEKTIIESLLERAAEYGKTSYDLVKLNIVDKASESISSLLAYAIVKIVIMIFILFLNLGIAFWVGDMLGKIFYGFFAVAAFYIIVAIILHFFMHKWMKRMFNDYFIKQMLN